MFAVGTGMHFGAVESTQIEIARAASAKDETQLALVAHLVKQAKSLDVPGRRVACTHASLAHGRFVQLSIVPTHQLELVAGAI